MEEGVKGEEGEGFVDNVVVGIGDVAVETT